MQKYIIGCLVLASISVLVVHYSSSDQGVQLAMQSPSQVAAMFEVRSEGRPENYKKAADEIIAFYENMTPKLDDNAKKPWKKALCEVLQSKGTIAAGLIAELECSLEA